MGEIFTDNLFLEQRLKFVYFYAKRLNRWVILRLTFNFIETLLLSFDYMN